MGTWDDLIDQVLPYQRSTNTPDGAGGSTQGWTQIIAAVPVSIQPATSTDILRFAQRGIKVDFKIYTTLDLNALLSGGIRIGDRFAAPSNVYYVVRDYKRDQNFNLSSEPLYCIGCERLIQA